MHLRLTGLFTLRSPLSHIGEVNSTTSSLVQEPIAQPDGSFEEVFAYGGNAWRGQLRDLAGTYMLSRLAFTVPLDAFHLLFSGGGIGGDQTVDIKKARAYRRLLPLVALFGGGIGNQILPGKLRVNISYPLCTEALPVLPREHHNEARQRYYADMTIEKSYSRMDDAKNPQYNALISGRADPPSASLPDSEPAEPVDAFGLFPELTPAPQKPAPKTQKAPRPREDGPATQMRFTSELLVAGTKLASVIDLPGITEVELGCLVSALDRFGFSPYIGGQSSRGHGLVDLDYDLIDLEARTREPFLRVDSDLTLLSTRAADAKSLYDQHLEAYNAALDDARPDIRQLLGALDRPS